MNESELEAELRALRPVAPSPGLKSRIALDLAETPQLVPAANPVHPATAEESVFARILRPLFWTAVGAAAAVAVMSSRATIEKPSHSPTPAEVAAAPDSTPETTRELLGTQQSPIRYEKDRGPVREVRARYLERVAWTDQRTGGRVEVSIPREDVYLQPIAMQ